jgi:hypothetical protein
MTPEGRVERLERIAKLFVRAGRRARVDLRQQDEKINILINLHMQNEELFARNEERFRENEERFARNEERFRENEERFARLSETIQVILGLQKQNEEKFRENEERLAKQAETIQVILGLQKQNEEKFRESEKRFARADILFVELAEVQAETGRNLNSLIEIIRDERNNNS